MNLNSRLVQILISAMNNNSVLVRDKNSVETSVKEEENVVAAVDVEVIGDKESTKKSFACEFCGKHFVQKSNMKAHIASAHLNVKFKCDQCEYETGQKVSLRRHQLAMHYGYTLQCDEEGCNKTFRWEADLRRHKDSKHYGIKFKCDLCEKMYSDQRALVYHFKSVHEKVMEKCPICEFETSDKMKMLHHKKKHDECFFKCEDCAYKTVRGSDMHRHRNEVHLKLHKFQCYLCDFQSVRRDHLMSHIKKAHISCAPPCGYCSSSYKDHLQHVNKNHYFD